MDSHEAELRADLQRVYGIDLDHAMAGEHTADHIAMLVSQLPPESRVREEVDPDAAWTLTDVLLATVCNQLAAWMYAMSDKRKRGNRPQPIGPSWMRKRERRLESRALPIDELMQILSKDRTVRDG